MGTAETVDRDELSSFIGGSDGANTHSTMLTPPHQVWGTVKHETKPLVPGFVRDDHTSLKIWPGSSTT